MLDEEQRQPRPGINPNNQLERDGPGGALNAMISGAAGLGLRVLKAPKFPSLSLRTGLPVGPFKNLVLRR